MLGYMANMAPPTPDPSPRGGGEAAGLSVRAFLSALPAAKALAPPSPLVGEGRGGGACLPKHPRHLFLAAG